MKKLLYRFEVDGKLRLSAFYVLAGFLLSLSSFNPVNANDASKMSDRTILNMPVLEDVVVKGTVVDNSGAPIPGVTISVQGTTIGTATDLDGAYSLSVPGGSTLVFSFIGFISQHVPLENKSEINIVLLEDMTSLDEVVVVGYGTQKRVNMTGSVATISGNELQHVPTNNLTNAIGGRMPGVIAVNGNGRPGSGSSLQIRGSSTLNNNSPLIVVDGIVRSDGFGNIDPNEVENISILKDASAAAVYGARAANGVILITTKRGKTGKPTISYSGMMGIQQPTQYPKLMSSYEYASIRNQALRNQGYDPANPTQSGLFYQDEDLERFKPGITDWYQETFKKKSVQSHHNLSVNGGTENIKYFTSLGYLDQDGMYDNINFKRYNLRANIDTKINDNLNVGVNIEGRQELSGTPGWDANTLFNLVVRSSPLKPAYHSSGRPFNTTGEHPVEMIYSSGYSNNKYNIFQGTLFFDQKLPFITEGLSVRGTGSYYSEQLFNKTFFTPYEMYDEDAEGNIINTKIVGGETSLSQQFQEINNITLNLSLNYSRSFENHELSGLLLYEQYGSKGNTFTARKQNFATNAKDEFFASGPANQTINGSGILNDARRSLVGRLNYSYDSKYLFEGTFRYDGSYRFPAEERFGIFPAASVGWRISEESFFQNSEALHFINSFKIRASKGLIGNDRVNAFQFVDAFGITAGSGPIVGGQALPYVSYGVYPNPNITWEKQNNNNIGFDALFLEGKLELEFDYFYRVTKDILWSRERSVPGTFGRALPNENYAEVESKGFEFSLTHQNNVKDFNYNLRLIGSFASNEVTQIDDPANALDFQTQLGRPMGFRVGYHSLGLFQSQEEAKNWMGGYQFGQESLAGDIKYADLDNDGQISFQDQKILSHYGSTPRIMFGLSGGFSWKGFDLNYLIQGAGQRTLLMSGSGRIMFRNGGSNNNFSYLADSWSPENKDAEYPLAWVDSRAMNDRNSEIWLKKAGYARLKSLDLGYTINSNWLNQRSIQGMRIYVSGLNLFTWSQIKEFDPEAETGTGDYYPQQRNISLGLNLTF